MSVAITTENKSYVTIKVFLKGGRDIVIGDVADMTFNDVAFPDGTLYKDLTFQQLQDTVISYESKNNVSLTLENKN